jgi:hypothetical protein
VLWIASIHNMLFRQDQTSDSTLTTNARLRAACVRACLQWVCVSLLSLTPALAQTEASPPVPTPPAQAPPAAPVQPPLAPTPAQAQTPPTPARQTDIYNFDHYIHAVPPNATDYHPINAEGRLIWFGRSTFGPRSLVAGVFSAGYGTAANHPPEYGTHWEGFGDRYGMRLTGVATSNAFEAALGSVWGEDPRYFHTVHQSFGTRAKNIVDLTFRAYHQDGERHLAYARYAAITGSNFLSNTWREPSEADWQHALIRTAEGFGARALSNAFSEFFPPIWRGIRHKPDPFAGP